jgi:hypothetical protein
MTRQIVFALLAAAVVLGTLPTAEARQYNQRPFLDPGGHSKIMTTVAKAKAFQGREFGPGSSGSSDSGDSTPACGQERNGVIVDRRADGQIVIAVTRDIVNAGGNVEIGRDCRR